jgi:hypothetical protein
MRLLGGLGVALAAAGALLPVQAAHADLRTRGTITSIAMDGPRVAVGVEHTLALCDRALVWNAVAGGVVTASAGRPSTTCPLNRANGGIGQVALAGTRAAWVVSFGGNTELTDRVVAASTSSPGREHALAAATFDPDSEAGERVTGLVGKGLLLAFGRSHLSRAGAVNGRILRVNGVTATQQLLASASGLTPLASDGSRVVVLRADGAVLVLTASGSVVSTISPGAAVRSAALVSGLLALQVAGNTALLYAPATGQPGGAVHLASGTAADIGLQGGRLAYRTYRAVHVVRLTDRKDVVVATAPQGILGAQIEDGGGLVYAYNVFETGLVRHLTFAQVAARLGSRHSVRRP